MKVPAIVSRLRSLVRRLLFWLPRTLEEERVPEHAHDHALVLSVVSPARVPRWRKLRYLLRVMPAGERRVFAVALVLAALSLAVAGIGYAAGKIVTVPVVGGTYTEALVGQPRSINPVDAPTNDVDRDFVRLIFSGLFRFDGMNAVPDLAEGYEWSDDGKTLTVRLRKDAQFHTLEQVTADDVAFTFDSLQNPERKSPLASSFRGVKMSIADPSTVVFHLERADAAFLSKLTVGILPSRLWQDISAANARLSDLNLKAIGSGPYRVKSFSRDNLGNIHSYTLERFDRYHGDRPFLKTLQFRFFADRQQALDAFRSGLVDGLAFATTHDAAKSEGSARVHDIKLDLPQETIAFFNIKNKILSTKEVRQALTLGIRRSDLVEALKGAATAVTDPYPDGPVTSTEPDIDRARQLLTDAGWAIPENGNVRILAPKKPAPAPSTSRTRSSAAATSTASATSTVIATPSSTELAITISAPNEPDLLAIAESLKRQWSLLGVRVSVEPLDAEDLMRKATRERSADVILLNILLGPEQDLYPFWSSGQTVDRGLNLSNVADRTIDEALDRLQKTTSTAAYDAARRGVADAILRLSPAAFLLRPTQHYLVVGKISVPRDRMTIATPAERFADIHRWYVKTGWRWK